MSIRLVRTCDACPEQYDAFENDRQVGYLRLRYGHFTAHMFGPMGKTVYEASTIGDGIFEPEERDGYLNAALQAIKRELKAQTTETLE